MLGIAVPRDGGLGDDADADNADDGNDDDETIMCTTVRIIMRRRTQKGAV